MAPFPTAEASVWKKYIEQAKAAVKSDPTGEFQMRPGPVLTALEDFKEFFTHEQEVDEDDEPLEEVIGIPVTHVLAVGTKDANHDLRLGWLTEELRILGVEMIIRCDLDIEPSNYAYVVKEVKEMFDRESVVDMVGRKLNASDLITVMVGPGTPALNFGLMAIYSSLMGQGLGCRLQLLYHGDARARDQALGGNYPSRSKMLMPLKMDGHQMPRLVWDDEVGRLHRRIQELEDTVKTMRDSAENGDGNKRISLLAAIEEVRRECDARGTQPTVRLIAEKLECSVQNVRQLARRNQLLDRLPREREPRQAKG